MAKSQIFSNSDGYKFVDGSTGQTTAVLDADGRFTLKDGGSSSNIEVFPNWTDFVHNMGEKPVKTGDEDDILTQLSNMGLGKCIPIDRSGTAPKENNVSKTTQTKQAAKPAPTKTASAPKATPKGKAEPKPKREKAEVELKPCACGCGEMVAREFRMGHDARVHGWAKKIEKGVMKMSELNPTAQKWMKEHGIKQGSAK